MDEIGEQTIKPDPNTEIIERRTKFQTQLEALLDKYYPADSDPNSTNLQDKNMVLKNVPNFVKFAFPTPDDKHESIEVTKIIEKMDNPEIFSEAAAILAEMIKDPRNGHEQVNQNWLKGSKNFAHENLNSGTTCKLVMQHLLATPLSSILGAMYRARKAA